MDQGLCQKTGLHSFAVICQDGVVVMFGTVHRNINQDRILYMLNSDAAGYRLFLCNHDRKETLPDDASVF